MRFVPLAVQGAWRLEPELRPDDRGLFARTWCVQEARDHGIEVTFVQTSTSFNDIAGTLRGLHYQAEPHAESKLVRCTAGSIFDVIVDLRPESPSHRKWHGETLSAKNRFGLYIPKGCAHGFVTLEGDSEVLYHISELYHPESACGVRWNDPALAIEWPRAPTRVAPRDAAFALLPPVDKP
jgi:dTDP-4-dehydrorhamnose 3,5-epimerase